MRFIIAREFYDQMLEQGHHLPDCYLRPGAYLQHMRKQTLVDIVGQRGSSGDASFVYEIKPPKGSAAVQDALAKTSYVGPAPVPFADYVEAVMAQSIKKLIVTRLSIQRAFEDLI